MLPAQVRFMFVMAAATAAAATSELADVRMVPSKLKNKSKHLVRTAPLLLLLLKGRPTQAFVLPTIRDAGAAASRRAPSARVDLDGQHLGMQGRRKIPQMVAALPSLPVVAATCTLPTCMGFWKSEYGVSYAYGAATAIMGGLLLRASSSAVAALHAAALLTYGLRLNTFLLWRELNVEALRKMRDKIESKAIAKGGRLKRLPFVLQCSVLYACLAAPTMVTSTTAASGLATATLVAIEWAGLLLAASGDIVKSYVKARKGTDALVTSGPYRFFRHPNYSGEQIMWTANMMAGFTAAASGGMSTLKSTAGWLIASVLGWAGIFFVLASATANLEKRQSEKREADEAYMAWKNKTWAGIALR